MGLDFDSIKVHNSLEAAIAGEEVGRLYKRFYNRGTEPDEYGTRKEKLEMIRQSQAKITTQKIVK
jgi:hypothetical protein